jgi:uncharacterized membrane protein HdeD (DUF308 family)
MAQPIDTSTSHLGFRCVLRKEECSMRQEEPDTDVPAAFGVAGSWQATLFVGVVTLVLGLVVSFRPSGSVNVIAVLLGILMLVSGLFHVVRVFGPNESHRLWLGISGLVLIVIGVVLLRHLHLTVALIGLFIGISWIFQGVSALVVGFSGGADEGRGWWIFFGVVSVLGGIVVTAVPVSSVMALAVLVGIWFVVVGLMEIAAGFMLRHEITKARTTMLHQPPRAGHGAATLLRGKASRRPRAASPTQRTRSAP